MPAGSTFEVHLAKSLESIHLYLRASVIEEVLEEMEPGFSAQHGLKPRLGQRDPTLVQLCMTVTAFLEEDPRNIIFVGHGLTTDTRAMLADGTMDAVITQDPDRLFEAALDASMGKVFSPYLWSYTLLRTCPQADLVPFVS